MMLAAMTGKERTEAELAPLLAEAGLHLTRLIPTPSVMSVVEAVASTATTARPTTGSTPEHPWRS
jgi:hypothetical protein